MMSNLKPLDWSILAGEGPDSGDLFANEVFPRAESCEYTVASLIRTMYSEMTGCLPEDPDSAEAIMRTNMVMEVEGVINTLQRWLVTFNQVVTVPESIEAVYVEMAKWDPSDREKFETSVREIRALQAKLTKFQPVHLKHLRSIVYREETPMEQLARSIRD
jgi:hypothetical protein